MQGHPNCSHLSFTLHLLSAKEGFTTINEDESSVLLLLILLLVAPSTDGIVESEPVISSGLKSVLC